MRLTIKSLRRIIAIGFLLAVNATASPSDAPPDSLAHSFPEKVGSFARVSATKNGAAIHGDVVDAAVAKYASGASEIEWSGSEFTAPERAFAELEKMMKSYENQGAGISSIKNAAGKVRYAVIETPQGIVCCWVNKQRQRFFFVVTGKMPEIEGFMRMQSTW